MKTTKVLFVSFLTVAVLGVFTAHGQSPAVPTDCNIKVEAKATNPTSGKSDGKIELKFSDTSKKYKVFLVNAGEERAKKDSGKVIENLSKGFYDILIVGEKRCWTQITVTLN